MNAGIILKIDVDDDDDDSFLLNSSGPLLMMYDCVSGTGPLSELNVDLWWKLVQNISTELDVLEKYRHFVPYRLQAQRFSIHEQLSSGRNFKLRKRT
jgi:hypothetical protein